ncbi:MAG: helix-turn-helix domain-containing protein [Solobacterium sp.]|jgi:transcriptional regulator with XRE-family HTH domain|nr:helix-turn-helix domain-containing protein [Solobacterium sp.]MCH4206576.1 helix-turn-helix domain-containing protein [Solobacterium sp.]MCH4228016.1 helix-turn-helix domain-containing protein [Solobacterium sp.]MCH4283435.1 helix-turn-helix domain-containing protein [Solobacterium sp.]
MDQDKLGHFLKELRNEKKMTQEDLAEQFGVARRTVSRWETGSNLPDLDILMEMSDYYDVDLRELLDGERKNQKMDKELEETVIKVADYSNDDKAKLTKRMHYLFIAGLLAFTVFVILYFTEKDDNFFGGLCLGLAFGMMAVGVIMTSRYAMKIRTCKRKLLHMQ